jgi:ABC-type dipeptide/oligopeptide/nickel transport system permease subunit
MLSSTEGNASGTGATPPGLLRQGFARASKDRTAIFAGALLMSVFVLATVGAPILEAVTGHRPEEQFIGGLTPEGIPLPPLSREVLADGTADPGGQVFILGTDRLGRDTLVRLAYGARVSIVVGFGATAAALLIGVPLGLAAGYFRGKIDAVASRATETAMAMPSLLFAIGLAAVLGPSLPIVIVVIALFSWYYPARIVRSAVLSLRGEAFVEAAIAAGATDGRVLLRHLLPQLAAPLIVYATSVVAINVLSEAGLSYLGLSVPPPSPTWGQMLADGVTTGLYRIQPWVAIIPGLALVITTLALNLLADVFREALVPAGRR